MRKALVIGSALGAPPLAIFAALALLPNSVFYRRGRPTPVGKFVNRTWAVWASFGLPPARMVTLEVERRRSGRIQAIPLVIASLGDERYLVSMLGKQSDWVRNLRAAGGSATVVHHGREDVTLIDVPAVSRAPILKAYLRAAPGARPHFDIDQNAALAEFERVAESYPVFRIVPR